MFQRSRNIPVSLSWTVAEGSTATPLDEYLHAQLSQSNVFANVRSLNMTGNVYMIPLLVHPASALEEFSLHNYIEWVDLPAHVFGDSAPKLRTLYLYQCSVPWGSEVLNNLTHFTIVYPSCYPDASGAPVYDDEEDHPTHAQLLAFLRNAPSLELISLSHALPVVSKDAS
ncbi:uncharacterized protein STEHIDRAFT_165055, partial [Stereum hirsutum FP-91666 SS1]|uniref:uncharacterized protein n=1 Tax=Stereum hirsutum (strain FP-91666) TaxID=721885 RepID=UPI000440CF0E